MPSISVDLDVFEKLPMLSRASGLQEGDVFLALGRMWAWCWREKIEHLAPGQLAGFFGSSEQKVVSALQDFGFIEQLTDGQIRVRGTSKYLRIAEARKKGAEATNEGKRRSSDAQATLKRRSSDAHLVSPSPTPPDPPFPSSSAISDQRSAISVERRSSDAQATLEPSAPGVQPALPGMEAEADGPEVKVNGQARAIFDYWREKLGHPQAKLDDKRRRRIEWALKTYGEPMVRKAIDGCAASDFHRGKNDRGACFDDLTLILRDAEHVERFADGTQAAEPPEKPLGF